MYLFAIYIGGSHEKSLIELHDIRFVVANTIEATYPVLRESWWGKPETLHLDAWGILRYVDGYSIHIRDTKPVDQQNTLYFVNLGGYDHSLFTELHKNVFIVAENAEEAKIKALQKILEWESPHRDYLFEIESLVNVQNLLSGGYIHLEPNIENIPFEFTCGYLPIGK